jgi:hypothetical protein
MTAQCTFGNLKNASKQHLLLLSSAYGAVPYIAFKRPCANARIGGMSISSADNFDVGAAVALASCPHCSVEFSKCHYARRCGSPNVGWRDI